MTEEQKRRAKATADFADKTHFYYHKVNGADAPCKRCEAEKR